MIKTTTEDQREALTRALYAVGYDRDELPLDEGIDSMRPWPHPCAYIYTSTTKEILRMTQGEYSDEGENYILVNSPAQMVRYLTQ